MAQVLLGPSERMLLKFQRKNMIESETSSEDSDHHKNDTVKLLNSNKNLVKLQQLIRINRILKFFCKGKNLVPGDRNLIKGIFVRTPVSAQFEQAMHQNVSMVINLAEMQQNLHSGVFNQDLYTNKASQIIQNNYIKSLNSHAMQRQAA